MLVNQGFGGIIENFGIEKLGYGRSDLTENNRQRLS